MEGMDFDEVFGEMEAENKDDKLEERVFGVSEVQQEGLKFSLAEKMRRHESDSDIDASSASNSQKSHSRSAILSRRDKENDLAEEEADKVVDMPDNDIYDRSRAVKKYAGSVSSADDFFRNQPKIIPSALKPKK